MARRFRKHLQEGKAHSAADARGASLRERKKSNNHTPPLLLPSSLPLHSLVTPGITSSPHPYLHTPASPLLRRSSYPAYLTIQHTPLLPDSFPPLFYPRSNTGLVLVHSRTSQDLACFFRNNGRPRIEPPMPEMGEQDRDHGDEGCNLEDREEYCAC